MYISGVPRSLICKDGDGIWLLDLRVFIVIHVSHSWCWMDLGMKEKRLSPLVLILRSLKIWEGSLFLKDRVSPADIPCSIIWGLVAQSCLTLCNPWSVACQAPLPMEFSRQEYWSGYPLPYPGDLTDPGIKPGSQHCRQILYLLSHQGICGAPIIQSVLWVNLLWELTTNLLSNWYGNEAARKIQLQF